MRFKEININEKGSYSYSLRKTGGFPLSFKTAKYSAKHSTKRNAKKTRLIYREEYQANRSANIKHWAKFTKFQRRKAYLFRLF